MPLPRLGYRAVTTTCVAAVPRDDRLAAAPILRGWIGPNAWIVTARSKRSSASSRANRALALLRDNNPNLPRSSAIKRGRIESDLPQQGRCACSHLGSRRPIILFDQFFDPQERGWWHPPPPQNGSGPSPFNQLRLLTLRFGSLLQRSALPSGKANLEWPNEDSASQAALYSPTSRITTPPEAIRGQPHARLCSVSLATSDPAVREICRLSGTKSAAGSDPAATQLSPRS